MKKYLGIIFLMYLFIISCHSGKSSKVETTDSSQSYNMKTDSQSAETNKKADTAIPAIAAPKTDTSINKTDNVKAAPRPKASVEVSKISWNLKDAMDRINQHDALRKKTTFIGFDFLQIRQPLRQTGELFDTPPAVMDENQHAYVQVTQNLENHGNEDIVNSYNNKGFFIRRLVMPIDSFKKIISPITGDLSKYRIIVEPGINPGTDTYGDYVQGNLYVVNSLNQPQTVKTTLHPCPKCAAVTSLQGFAKKQVRK